MKEISKYMVYDKRDKEYNQRIEREKEKVYEKLSEMLGISEKIVGIGEIQRLLERLDQVDGEKRDILEEHRMERMSRKK